VEKYDRIVHVNVVSNLYTRLFYYHVRSWPGVSLCLDCRKLFRQSWNFCFLSIANFERSGIRGRYLNHSIVLLYCQIKIDPLQQQREIPQYHPKKKLLLTNRSRCKRRRNANGYILQQIDDSVSADKCLCSSSALCLYFPHKIHRPPIAIDL
jgi:hypothetical protein